MPISDWIAFGALVVAALGPTFGRVSAGGRRDGKVDAVLEELTKITADHEARLRKGRL